MKLPYQGKKIRQLEIDRETKTIQIEKATQKILESIKNKGSDLEQENNIRFRNILYVDLRDIDEQICNLSNKRKQYGYEIQERTVRHFGV